MAEVNLFGQILVHMKEIFIRIIFMEQENIVGLMVEFTKVNGSTIKWKVKVFSLGVMAVDTLDNTKMIKSMDKEHLNGQMVVDM